MTKIKKFKKNLINNFLLVNEKNVEKSPSNYSISIEMLFLNTFGFCDFQKKTCDQKQITRGIIIRNMLNEIDD